MAMRCCCPPGELLRVRRRLVGQADTLEQHHRLGDDLASGAPEDLGRSFDHVLQHRAVRKEVEALEHHAGVAPRPRDRGLLRLDQPSAVTGGADELAVDEDDPRVDRLEAIHAAQQGRLARPAGADQARHGTCGDPERHVFEHGVVAEGLPHSADLDHVARHATGSFDFLTRPARRGVKPLP